MSSWLVQRIVVPAGTVNGLGEKTKLSILTCIAGLSSTVAPKVLDRPAIMMIKMASVARPNVKAVLFMIAVLLASLGSCDLFQSRIGYAQRMLALDIIHVANPQQAL